MADATNAVAIARSVANTRAAVLCLTEVIIHLLVWGSLGKI
jgi:hypothetical protein